jgi:hypothetical protein
MTVRQIGDWALEDRLGERGKSMVVLFLDSGDRNAFPLRAEFRRVAREHRDAEFYEIDVLENPSVVQKYGLPPSPMVLVFVDGIDVGRHMGTLMAATVDRVLGLPPLEDDDSRP